MSDGASRTVGTRPVSFDDDAAIAQWYAVMSAAEAEKPLFLWPSLEVALRTWRIPRADREELFLLAEVDGVPAGAGRVSLSFGDNEHLAHLLLFVAPEHRRTGVGTALLAELERTAVARGRHTLHTGVTQPPGVRGAGAAFAARHGYAEVSLEHLKAVDLAATADRLPALAEQAASRSAGYELVWWTDAAPDEHVASLAHLYTRFLGEIPLGDLDLQPQQWDVARVRQAEDRRRSAGAQTLLVAAVAPDGTLAGYTDLAVSDGATHAEIDGTLVLPEHRGHALGLAMKVRLHQLTPRQLPQATFIVTGNAGVNRWMNAVNDTLGYVVVEELIDVQKKLHPTPGGHP